MLPIPAPDPPPLPPSVLKALLLLLMQGLRELESLPGPHPPFAGTDQEAEWLGRYLASLNSK